MTQRSIPDRMTIKRLRILLQIEKNHRDIKSEVALANMLEMDRGNLQRELCLLLDERWVSVKKNQNGNRYFLTGGGIEALSKLRSAVAA